MEKVVSWEEYAKHTNNLDCWILIDGRIYNVSTFLAEHPGGDEILLKYSGLDGSKPFNQQHHTPYAVSIRDSRVEGVIESPEMPAGHEDRVRRIKQEYLDIKKQKDEERRSQILGSGKEAKTGHHTQIGGKKVFARAEVAKHNNDKDCWIIFESKVYDLTTFLDDHPGGGSKLLEVAGRDGTADFDKVMHSDSAKRSREKYFIGYLEGYVPPKGKISGEFWGMLLLTIILIVYSIYFFGKRDS